MKPGRRSSSTFSVTWNLLLLCFLGVLGAGMMSFGAPWAAVDTGAAPLSLLIGPTFGGVCWLEPAATEDEEEEEEGEPVGDKPLGGACDCVAG